MSKHTVTIDVSSLTPETITTIIEALEKRAIKNNNFPWGRDPKTGTWATDRATEQLNLACQLARVLHEVRG